MAGLAHGIEAVAIYDPNAGSGDQVSVLFDALDAQLSNIQIGGTVDGDREDVWGNMFFPGKLAEMNIEALDTGGVKLAALNTWYDANKQVAAVVLLSKGESVIHWLDINRLHEPKSTDIRAGFSGRSDFTKFSFRRHGGSSHNIHRVVNIVSYLSALSATSSSAQEREVVFPFPGRVLRASVDVTTVGTLNVASKDFELEFLDADGTSLSDSTKSLADGRVELIATTPASTHSVKLTVPSTNTTFTVSELSLRADGSYEYVDG